MKQTLFLLVTATVFLTALTQCNQKYNKKSDTCKILKGDYLGQTPPGDAAELFAPGIVSTGFNDHDIVVSPDMNEIFFVRSSSFDSHASIIYYKRENGEWMKPQLAPFITTSHRYGSPFLSPDGNTMYFNTQRPVEGIEENNISNIWISERKENSWEKARPLTEVNTTDQEQYPSVAANGNIYFYRKDASNNYDIYYCEFLDNQYSSAKKIGGGVNSQYPEFHTYIAPDESYLIFDRYLPDRNMDLFISFRKEDGSWTQAVNMGERVNHKTAIDVRPYVSPDGKYLFFSSRRRIESNRNDSLTYTGYMNRLANPGNVSEDIYWVDAKIIDELRSKVLGL